MAKQISTNTRAAIAANYLTTQFQQIQMVERSVKYNDKIEYNVALLASQLFSSLKLYCELNNVDLDFSFMRKKVSPVDKFLFVINSFDKIIPKGWELNIERENDIHFIVLYRRHHHTDDAHIIPVEVLKFLKEKNHPYYDYVLNFLRFLNHKQRLRFIHEYDDYMLECIESNLIETLTDQHGIQEDDIPYFFAENDDCDEIQAYENLQDYKTGYIKDWVDIIYKKPNSKILFDLENDKSQHQIINIMQDGLKLFHKEISIFYYDYMDHDTDFQNEEPMVVLERTIGFCWTFDDYLFNKFDNWITAEVNEGGMQNPVSSYFLNKEQTNKITDTDFPERFCKWTSKFITQIEQLKLEVK